MKPLSSPLTQLQATYDVVVVGSGYGGGIAASRFARAGLSVAVLERGREYLPGDFPDTLTEAAGAMQVRGQRRRTGSETALFDFRNHADLDVLVGCGLGGTSLINAGVVLEPDPRVFDDPVWPQAFRDDLDGGVAEGFRRARAMLAPATYPDDRPEPAKYQALRESAERLGAPVRKVPLAITFGDDRQPNPSGVQQRPCIACGDCVSGCNHTSKNTVHVTYLADAFQHGASLFTEVQVGWIEQAADGWRVHVSPKNLGRDAFGAPEMFVSATRVVLAAGALGSTEILLRSREKGLDVSDTLGRRFTGNGDVLAFAYDVNRRVHGIGTGPRTPDADDAVGPCITGMIDTRHPDKPLEDGLSIEEGAIPGAISGVVPAGLAAAAAWVGKKLEPLRDEDRREGRRALAGLMRQGGYAAVHRTQTFLVMGHDETRGVLTLQDDELDIEWPGVGDERVAKIANDHLADATEALGGTYVVNPMWTQALGHQMVTVHPLGGCAMAEDASAGVVDHAGRVFRGHDGTDVHDGLYVMDGSIVPRSLGTNPLLTISAVSERCVQIVTDALGLALDVERPAPLERQATARPMSLRFTERMTGSVAAVDGSETTTDLSFTVTVTLDDVQATLDDPATGHGTLVGTVTAPGLSDAPLTVHGGHFVLFDPDPDDPRAHRMRYRMPLLASDGSRYLFEGFKVVRDDEGFDAWSDTTTLFVTVERQVDAPAAASPASSDAPARFEGTLRIRPLDFARQMTTMRVDGAPDERTRLATVARFGRLFAGALFDTYGAVAAPHVRFDPSAPPRKRRELAAPLPEVHPFTTEDGVHLKLTRFRGGDRGPVLLVHGLGVSSRIFSLDTIDVNLVEYLVDDGYDVWTLDWRGSIDVPASKGSFTVDDVARYDHPAALDAVRRLTGAADVHVLAHCVGSITFSASVLGGWARGVRSAFLTQVSTHMRPPAFTRFKTGLHVPGFLKAMGVKSLDGYTDEDASWSDRLFETALRLHPIQAEERCTSAVCKRITFMYGGLFEHDQLNRATHDTLHEHFGVANLTVFKQLAAAARHGKLVDRRGRDAYLPHVDRWTMPTTLLSGEENDCFLPVSTERTLDYLGSGTTPPPLQRHVIPDYGHIDVFLGRNAWSDVYPTIADHFASI